MTLRPETVSETVISLPIKVDSEGVLTLILLLQHVFFASAKDENGRLLALPLEIHVKVIDINDNPPTCPSKMTVFEVQENEIVGKK